MIARAELIDHICSALNSCAEKAKVKFADSVKEVGIKYCYVDDLLPQPIAQAIYDAFPGPNEMRLMSSFREVKYTSKNLDEIDPVLKEITFAIQESAVVRIVEDITGIARQIPDPTLYAGGVSVMGKGHFLNPHIDNSHDGSRRYYRTLNLLYYVTPGWTLESGGNLELWDASVGRPQTIASKFNRLVIMETNPWSWHSVCPVKVDRFRCCVSNYYFSPVSPVGRDYFNVTSFSARPDQKFRRGVAWIDNRLRQAVRVFVPRGVGKRDVYDMRKD